VVELREAAESALLGELRFDNGQARPLGAKGRRTRARILQGAGDAFARVGPAATTMSTIARLSGVGTGTIYQYFRSKEEVLTALIGEWTLRALGQVRRWDPAEGRDGLRWLISRFVTGYASTAEFQRAWEEASLVDPQLSTLRANLTEVYARRFADAFRQGEEAGLLSAGEEPLETARALCAMVDRYCHQVFVTGARPDISPERAATLLTDIWAAAIHLT